jgi:aspartate/methionine/tyrosine aminotransferase
MPMAMKEAKNLAEFLPQLLSEIDKKKREVSTLSGSLGVIDMMNCPDRERRDMPAYSLLAIALDCPTPQVTCSVWAEVSKNYDYTSAAGFISKIFVETGIIVTPDNRFGAAGEGYFQSEGTIKTEQLREAAIRSQ